jgi:phage terminase large subunit-like protein
VGRRRKTIVDLVRDQTFLARKDEQLLSGREALPVARARAVPAGVPGRGRARPELARAVSLELQQRLRGPDGATAIFGDLETQIRKLGRHGSYVQLERFAAANFRHFAGPAAGRPFTFEVFQRRFVRRFSRRDRHGRRVYNVGLLGIPKGNGKTPLAAVLGTHALAAARDEMPEVYVLAGAKDQADIGHTFARNNIEHGPLAAWLTVGAAITYPANLGIFEILSSDGDLAHGTNVSAAIVDEWWQFLHRKQREGYLALAEALHKRGGESWLLAITTAGWTHDSQLGEFYDAAVANPLLRVRNNGFLLELDDPEAGVLMHWYGIPEGDEYDIEDPAVIRAANPLSTIDPRDIIRSLLRPGADEYDFRRLHGNQWTKTKGIWLPTGSWGKLADDELEIPLGADIYVGVDVAHSYDTTAVAWAWRAPDGRIVVRCHVWSVRAEAPAHEHVDDFYNQDAEHLAELFIYSLGERYRIREVVADPNYFGSELRRLGRRFESAPLFPQSKEMTEYVQEFYRLVDAKAIAHDGDRVGALHVAAIAGEKDSNGYWRIRKLNTPNPMDAGTAKIIAVGRCSHAPDPVKPWAARW